MSILGRPQESDKGNLAAPLQPVPKGVLRVEALASSPMVVAAAKALANLHAEACNVNRDDLWIVNGPEFLEEAHAVLTACGAFETRLALMQLLGAFEVSIHDHADSPACRRARAALSRATPADQGEA